MLLIEGAPSFMSEKVLDTVGRSRTIQ